MKVMSKAKYKDEELLIGQQNFSNGTVQVIYKNEYIICDMFQDEVGDIGFIFIGGHKFYFSYDVTML